MPSGAYDHTPHGLKSIFVKIIIFACYIHLKLPKLPFLAL
jgi:hypothetical protein